jgi:hypothetical protein
MEAPSLVTNTTNATNTTITTNQAKVIPLSMQEPKRMISNRSCMSM